MFIKESWRFVLEEDFEHVSPLLSNISFSNNFVVIADSKIIIKKDYAWDGCSPAIKIRLGKLLPQGIWVGPWDGPLNKNCYSVSRRASLVHDALCQFRDEIDIGKEASVRIFEELLKLDNAPSWMVSLYPWFVKHVGPQDWKG